MGKIKKLKGGFDIFVTYVSDFTMIDEDRKFLLATWQGTYIGEV